MAARWTPDGVATPPIEVDVAPFLDSLQILPLGIGHLSPDRLRRPVARLDDFAARVTRVRPGGTREVAGERSSVRQSVVNSTSQHKAVKSIDRAA